MKIEGTYTFQAPAAEVWNCLMDQPTIQRSLPGLERLTSTDKQTYSFTIHISHAPLRGTYTGDASVIIQDYPSLYHLKIEGEGQTRTFVCECDIQISTHDENTIVSYQGTVHLGRSGTLIPAQLVKATIKVLLQQFFTTLAQQLRTRVEERVSIATLEEMYEMPFMEEQTKENGFIKELQKPLTTLHRLIRVLGLGKQNLEAEERWVQRLQRFGILAILLLLVWAGTRLTRRLLNHS